MQDQFYSIDRVFRQLASDLNYDISCEEISTYLQSLQSVGLVKLADCCHEFCEEGRPAGSFPSIKEFVRKIEEMESRRLPTATTVVDWQA